MSIDTNKPVKTNRPLDWIITGNLSEEVKDLLLEIFSTNDGKHLKGYPAININTLSNPMQVGICPSIIVDPINTALQAQIQATSGFTAGVTNSARGALVTFAMEGVLNGSGNMDAVRTPTWFKSLTTTAAGPTQIVASNATKKHRILGGIVICAGAAAAAGAELVSIIDNVTDTGLDFGFYTPTAANLALGIGANAGTSVTFDLKPNGYLCIAVNTAINITLSVALTAGNVTVILWGDDE